MNIILIACLLTYALSVVCGYFLSLHALSDWHSAYWRRRELRSLALAHPVLRQLGLTRAIPVRAPADSDWTEAYRWTMTPFANTAFVVSTLVLALAYGAGFLRETTSAHSAAQ